MKTFMAIFVAAFAGMFIGSVVTAQNQSQRGFAYDQKREQPIPEKQGHCWACMHGCTAEQDFRYCGWPPAYTQTPREEPSK